MRGVDPVQAQAHMNTFMGAVTQAEAGMRAPTTGDMAQVSALRNNVTDVMNNVAARLLENVMAPALTAGIDKALGTEGQKQFMGAVHQAADAMRRGDHAAAQSYLNTANETMAQAIATPEGAALADAREVRSLRNTMAVAMANVAANALSCPVISTS